MMASAEGQRGLDLDAEPVWRRAAAIVCAVDDKAARHDRFYPEETLRDPVLGGDALKAQSLGRSAAGRRHRQIAHQALVDFGTEVKCNAPLALTSIDKADRSALGKERLGKTIGEQLRRMFIGYQGGDRGIRWVHRRLVIHCSIDRFESSTPNSQDRH